MSRKRNRFQPAWAAALVLGCTLAAQGEETLLFHTWDFSEIYSNADGTIQFIELREAQGLSSQNDLSTHACKTTANCFPYLTDLPSTATANKRFLMATAAAAALPGCPAPDYIIPANFFNFAGDTLQFGMNMTCTLGTQDTWTFGAGALPTDGVTALNCTNHAPPVNSCQSTFTAVNSPTNFAGVTGSIDASPPCVGDINDDGVVGPNDLALLLGAWGPNPGHPADLNGDGVVGPNDLALLLGNWGPCS